MILDKFMKPKWQHRNSDVRKSAVEEMDNLDVLSEIAQHDEAPVVRQAAVRKIEDLSLLKNIAHHDADESVREFANQRFKQVLCGQKVPALPLNDRLGWLNKTTEVELWEHVAVHGQEFELRLAALQRVEREGLLGDIAINDPISKVRLVALEKINQKSTLERIYKLTRSRDKRVSRIVREKLDKLIEQNERYLKVRSECESICKQLELLIPVDPVALAKKNDRYGEREHAEIKRLQECWQTMEVEVEAELKTRFVQLKQSFADAFAKYQQEREILNQREQALMPIRSARQRICEQTEQLLAEMQALQLINDGEKNQSLSESLTRLKNQWAEISPVEDLTEEQQWQNRFDQIYQSAEKCYRTLQTYFKMTMTFESWCQRVESLLNHRVMIKPSQLKELTDEGTVLVQSAKLSPLFNELNSRFHQLRQSLEKRLQQQAEEYEQSVNTLKQVLKDLESSLEKGELHTAISLDQQAQTLLQTVAHGSSTRHKALENRFQQCTSRIRELRSWQRWGDNRERENLCLQIESLQHREDDNPEETVRLIREAQTTWKHLGSSGYSRTLWERFNRACNTAYEPCRAYFEAQSQERKDNLARIELLCDQLESYVKTIHWEQPDWKAIHHFIREIEGRWGTVGPTDRKAKKSLQNRFNKAMGIIQSHLQEEHQRNLHQREQLIEQVKVVDTKNLNQAIEDVKRLQAQWQVSVPGNRREERRLWKKFREACDTIFDLRKQQQDELEKERQSNLEAKQVLCDQIESLTCLEGEAIKTVLGQLKKLQGLWKELGLVPKKDAGKIDKRFATVCKQVESFHQAYIMAEQREQLQQLKQKSLLCTELEQLWHQQTVSGHQAIQDRFTEVRGQWAELPPLADAEAEKMITQRFEQVNDAIRQNKLFELDQAGLKARETLCIRLEILAGIESPPEAQEARMAYQVIRLSEAMTGGSLVSMDKLTEAREIERSWYLTRFLTIKEQVMSLENRFSRAIEAFYARSSQ